MTDVATGRDAYLDAFLQAARPAVTGDLAAWQGTLEALEAEYGPSPNHAYATAAVQFRGHRYRYGGASGPPTTRRGSRPGCTPPYSSNAY